MGGAGERFAARHGRTPDVARPGGECPREPRHRPPGRRTHRARRCRRRRGTQTGDGPVLTLEVAEAIRDAALGEARILDRIHGLDLRVVTVDDAAFPTRLAAIEHPPPVLFVRGDPAALDAARVVAVVGTRRPTIAGRGVAARIARALTTADATVVSGLAIGIDGVAHAATIENAGADDRGPRRRTRLDPPTGPRQARDGDRRGRRGRRLRARAGHRAEGLELPAAESDHQRPVGRDGRRRGAGPQRGAADRGPGPRTGSGVLPRARVDRRAPERRVSRVPARVPGECPDRLGHPPAHRGPGLRGPAGDRRPAAAGSRRRRSRASAARSGRPPHGSPRRWSTACPRSTSWSR